jgi:DNA-binding transcriptional LysR family regulator
LQALERRLGLPLFHRTTRKIALTEAGAKLLAQLGPAAETIIDTLDDLTQLQVRPSGTLRLLVHRMALSQVIEPILPAFRRTYPDVHVEIVVNDAQIELVEGGYDDAALLRLLAVKGMGLVYTSSLQAAPELSAGLLEPVLESFMPARDSLFIYFPRSSRGQPKLRAFVEACARSAR